MKALTFSQFGGPEVLEYRSVADPVRQPNHVLVKIAAIGLNFADIYRRKGNYHLTGQAPYIAGYEGAGIVVDPGNSAFQVGDRVGFADVPFANAELVSAPEDHLIPLPDEIGFDMAAAVLLQGLTAHYLAEDSYIVKAGEIVLIHAASGGVGQILTQICKLKGATVIGLTTSEQKKAKILEVGADLALNLKDDWKADVLKFTHEKGVDVAYDSVGSTLHESLELTKTAGSVVFYGMSGGDPSPVDPRVLMDGSKSLIGGDLWSFLNSGAERKRRAAILFKWITDGSITITTPVKFKLSEGNLAHGFLEGSRSAGKVLMIPDAVWDHPENL